MELGSQAYTSVDMLEWDGRYEKMLETQTNMKKLDTQRIGRDVGTM